MDIRAFGGTVREAQGLIEVDAETFGDCAYAAQTIADLISDPAQWTAVAVMEGQVAGFVSCFRTQSLSADRWEVDELAVRPVYQGRGIGTRLVAYAVGHGVSTQRATVARAVVAVGNQASQRTFAANGFEVTAEADLLLYEVSGRVPRPALAVGPAVRRARPGDAHAIAALSAQPPQRVATLLECGESAYLLAQQGDRVLGYAELLYVRTLQYQGFWLESLAIAGDEAKTVGVLIAAAIEEAKARPEADVVGYLVPQDAPARYEVCVSQGFARVERYALLQRDLRATRTDLGDGQQW